MQEPLREVCVVQNPLKLLELAALCPHYKTLSSGELKTVTAESIITLLEDEEEQISHVTEQRNIRIRFYASGLAELEEVDEYQWMYRQLQEPQGDH